MSEIPEENEVTSSAEAPKTEPLPEEVEAVMPATEPALPAEVQETPNDVETSSPAAPVADNVVAAEPVEFAGVPEEPIPENASAAEPATGGSEEPIAESAAPAEPAANGGAVEESAPSSALMTADAMPLIQVLEALLFSTDTPLSPGKLAEVCGLDTTKPVKEVIEQLNKVYEERQAAYRIEERAGGYQLLTLPQYADYIYRLVRKKDEGKLTPASLETLAIIAYKQPIIRADVEAIRGVACGEVLRSLMEHNLVKIVGRAELIGRPMLYGTTRYFLEVFGLANLKDLPKAEQLKEPR